MMAITYSNPWPNMPTVRVPKLHRVHFRHHNALLMRAWLVANCQAAWYVSPGWSGNFVEFEDDQDATAFALVWA